jgi:hypothetical protein
LGLDSDFDLLNTADISTRLPYFSTKQIIILLLFRGKLQIPALDLGPLVKELPIEVNAHSYTGMLFVECKGIPTYIYNLEPTISYGAWREELNRVRQTFRCLTYDIIVTTLREASIGPIDHIASY